MTKHTPLIAASERRAAAMLDMAPAEFRKLVERGALPRPTTIAGMHKRWRVADLEAILSGEAINDEFEP